MINGGQFFDNSTKDEVPKKDTNAVIGKVGEKVEQGAKSPTPESAAQPNNAITEVQKATPAEHNKASSLGLVESLYQKFVPLVTFTEYLPNGGDEVKEKAAKLVGDETKPVVVTKGAPYSHDQLLKLAEEFERNGRDLPGENRDSDKEALARVIYRNLHREGQSPDGKAKGIGYLTDPEKNWVESVQFENGLKSFQLRATVTGDEPGQQTAFLHGPEGKEFIKDYIWARNELRALNSADFLEINANTLENNLSKITTNLENAAKRTGNASPPTGNAGDMNKPQTPAEAATRPKLVVPTTAEFEKAIKGAKSDAEAIYQTKLYVAKLVGKEVIDGKLNLANDEDEAKFQTAYADAANKIKASLPDGTKFRDAAIKESGDIAIKAKGTSPLAYYDDLKKDIKKAEDDLNPQAAKERDKQIDAARRAYLRKELEKTEALPTISPSGLRTAPTEIITDLSAKHNQDVYDALKDLVPKFAAWDSWGTVATFPETDRTAFKEKLTQKNGTERSPEELEAIYKRYQEAYKDPAVYPNDEWWFGRRRRDVDNGTGIPYLGRAVQTLGTALIAGTAYYYGKDTEFGKAIGGGAKKFTLAKEVAKAEQNTVDVITSIKEKLPKGYDTYERASGYLSIPAVKNEITHGNKGLEAAYDKVTGLIGVEVNQPRTGGPNLAEFLNAEQARAQGVIDVRAGEGVRAWIGRQFGRTPAADASTTTDATKPTVTEAEKAAVETKAFQRSILENILSTGDKRGIPTDHVWGWGAMQANLKDPMHRAVYLAGAAEGDVHTQAYDALISKVDLAANDAKATKITPGQWIVKEYEPNASALRTFKKDALTALTAAGIDLDAKEDKDKYRDAASELKKLLPSLDPATGEELKKNLIDPLFDGNSKESIGVLLNKATESPALQILDMLKSSPLTKAEKVEMWDKFYRNMLDRQHRNTIGNKTDMATFVTLRTQVDGYIKQCVDATDPTKTKPGFEERYKALKGLETDINTAMVPAINQQLKCDALAQKMKDCYEIDPVTGKVAKDAKGRPIVDKAYKAEYAKLEKEKAKEDIILSKMQGPKAKPDGKSKPSGPATPGEGKTVSEVLAGDKPLKPVELSFSHRTAEAGHYLQLRMLPTSGPNPVVTVVEITDSTTGKTEKKSATETRDIAAANYEKAGKPALARELKDNLPREQAELVLTHLASGTDLTHIEMKAQELEMASGHKPGSGRSARALFIKQLIAPALLGAGMAIKAYQGAPTEQKLPDLREGLTPPSS